MFPLSEDKKREIVPVVSAMKDDGFDRELTKHVTRRLISKERITRDFEETTRLVYDSIRLKVNSKVLTIIFSDDPDATYELTIPKDQQKFYRNEDEIKKIVRDLIVAAYSGKIHKNILRKKVRACMSAILETVNGKEFRKELEIQGVF